MNYIRLCFERPDAEINKLEGRVLDDSFVSTVVEDADTTVVTPSGDVHAVFLKRAIPQGTYEAAYPFLLKAASSSVIGGFRGTAAGTGTQPSYKKDGTLSNMRRVPKEERLLGAKDGVLGYLDQNNFSPCRLTAYTRNHWEQFGSTVLPYIQAVDGLFQTHMPERHAAQLSVASTTPGYAIEGTSFSTVTVNLNFATACHRDSGDLAEGAGVITCFTSGNFTGGTLVFPKWNLGFNLSSGDALLSDVHQLHGNLPLVGEKGEYQRLSCVFYFRERLQDCNG
jgi:Oxygenase domain of the 2OGFeDO superfamily